MNSPESRHSFYSQIAEEGPAVAGAPAPVAVPTPPGKVAEVAEVHRKRWFSARDRAFGLA